MAIFYASYRSDIAPLSPRFGARAADYTLFDNDRMTASTDAGADGQLAQGQFALAPPDDSPLGQINRVMAMLRRGETTAALDRALKLMQEKSLPDDLKQHLRNAAHVGITDLKITGHSTEARDYARLFQLDETAPAPVFTMNGPSLSGPSLAPSF